MSVFFLQHPRETDLALFAGGESGPFARWRIERHVESCEQCQSLAAAYFRLPDELRELAEVPHIDWNEMAAAIEVGVENDRLASESQRNRGFVPPVAWQAGLAVAGVVIALVIVRGPQLEQSLGDAPKTVSEVGTDEAVDTVTGIVESKTVVAEAPGEPMRQDARGEVPAAAVAPRDALVSDVAAPAPPPPPRTGATAAKVASAEGSVTVGGQTTPSAITAEQRLRENAAASVRSASALAGLSEGAEADARKVHQLLIAALAQGGDAGLEQALSDFRDDPAVEMQRLRRVFEQDGLQAVKLTLDSMDH